MVHPGRDGRSAVIRMAPPWEEPLNNIVQNGGLVNRSPLDWPVEKEKSEAYASDFSHLSCLFRFRRRASGEVKAGRQRLKFRNGKRLGEVVSLDEIGMDLAEIVDLVLGLNTLGDALDIQSLGQFGNAADDAQGRIPAE